MPNHMAKAGVSYAAPVGVTAGVFNTFFSERHDVNILKPTRKLVNPLADGFNWLSVNLIFDITKLFHIARSPNIEVKFYGENLLNKKGYDPEFSRKNINTIPKHSGVFLMGEVKVSF